MEFPLEVSGDPSSLTYEWIELRDSIAREAPRSVSGAAFITPATPGYYRLAIVRGVDRQIIAQPTVAVMVPLPNDLADKITRLASSRFVLRTPI